MKVEEEEEEATRYPASPQFSFLLPNLKAPRPRVSSGPGGERQAAGTSCRPLCSISQISSLLTLPAEMRNSSTSHSVSLFFQKPEREGRWVGVRVGGSKGASCKAGADGLREG